MAGGSLSDRLADLRCLDLSAAGEPAAAAKLFFEKVRDPYLFRVGEIVVHVEFGGPSSAPLQTHIQNLLSRASDARS